MSKININIKKDGTKHICLENIKDGPGVSDIKESRGRKKINQDLEKAPRILKIKDKIHKKNKKRRYEFKISYIVAFVFIIILGFAFYFGYNFLKKDRVLRILPENTVFYGKIDLKKAKKDYSGGAFGRAIDRFTSKDVFMREIASIIDENILDNYGLDFRADISEEITNEVSIASFQDSSSKLNLHTILAIGVKNKQNIKNIINKSVDIDYINNYSYEESEIFEIVFRNEDNNFYYSFFGDILILAKDDKAIEEMLTVSAKKKPSLASNKAFRDATPYSYRFENNYFYTNFSLISFENIENYDLFNIELNKSFIFYSFLKKAGPLSFYLKPENNGLNLFGHTAQVEDKNNETSITDFALDKASVVYSGHNLQHNIVEYIGMFSEEDEGVASIRNMVGALETEYSLNLTKDIEPLFKNKSEISVISEETGDELLLVLKAQDNEDSKKRMKKIEKAISHYFGIMYPIEKEFELADGSIGYELFANDKAFPFKDIKLSGNKIRSIVNPEIEQHYSYVFYKDYLILSTQEKLLEEAISIGQNNQSLVNNADYQEIFNGRTSNNDILYLDLAKIYDKMGTSENGFYNSFKKFVLTQENKTNGMDFVGTFLVE